MDVDAIVDFLLLLKYNILEIETIMIASEYNNDNKVNCDNTKSFLKK